MKCGAKGEVQSGTERVQHISLFTNTGSSDFAQIKLFLIDIQVMNVEYRMSIAEFRYWKYMQIL